MIMSQPQYIDHLLEFTKELYRLIFNFSQQSSYLKCGNNSKVRLHTTGLDKTGDLSFPLRMHNWTHWIRKNLPPDMANRYLALEERVTIFQRLNADDVTTEEHLKELRNNMNERSDVLKIREVKLQQHNVHLYLDRISVFSSVIRHVISTDTPLGHFHMINSEVTLKESLRWKSLDDMSLTELRMLTLTNFTKNLLNILHDPNISHQVCEWSQESSVQHARNLLCGPVLNQDGTKDVMTKAQQLLDKRSDDMRSMAEHRYGYRLTSSSDWEQYKRYFHKLGQAAVTIELLEQKPHKGIKIGLNHCSTTHKGPAFIFYNCARLGVLFGKYNKKVEEGIYPGLPPIEEINFHLLKESEEWELLYVYILQYPSVIRSCVSVDEDGIILQILPQNLIMFLSRLSCQFSTYYRRIKILMEPREHLFAILHARLYLLKALEIVFHNALCLLDIEPVKRM